MASPCSPSPANLVWLFLPHHKTGTVLSNTLLSLLERDGGVARLPCMQAAPRMGHRTMATPAAALKCLVSEARQAKQRHVVEKVPPAIDLPTLHRAFGQRLRLVHLYRDPVDVALSNYYYVCRGRG